MLEGWNRGLALHLLPGTFPPGKGSPQGGRQQGEVALEVHGAQLVGPGVSLLLCWKWVVQTRRRQAYTYKRGG